MVSEVKTSLQEIKLWAEFIYTILQYTDLQSFSLEWN